MGQAVNPNVSVDCVVFGFDNTQLNVLLIKQKELKEGMHSQYALPGDLVLKDESLDDAANRVLKELTLLEGIFLRQFHSFGDPNRVSNIKDLDWLQSYRQNPQARVITVGYLALVRMEDFSPAASSFAEEVFWKEVHEVPSLAFDHDAIFEAALARLKEDFTHQKIGLELLPEKFTLSQFQALHEIILEKKLDKRNFRKKVLKEKWVVPLEEKQQGVLHKPAQLFALNQEDLVEEE